LARDTIKKAIFSRKFRDSCRFVSEQVYGPKGLLAYHFFDFINVHYFNNRLPMPYIIWGLTAHGGCVAWASTVQDRSRPPIITLHPSLMECGEKPNPWGLPSEWLGPAMMFDTLLHECIHVHIASNLGGTRGRSSHDCKRWVRQVNRIAPLLGFAGVDAGQTKLMRVPMLNAPRKTCGKLPTRVVRRTLGNVPFRTVAGFPRSLRIHLGQASEHYRQNRVPIG
jgi:hypothetical protein